MLTPMEGGRSKSQQDAGPPPYVSLARAEAGLPGPARVHLIRHHWRQLRLDVGRYAGRGDIEGVGRCQRAMYWAERELGLR
jgi:hypothetical protein